VNGNPLSYVDALGLAGERTAPNGQQITAELLAQEARAIQAQIRTVNPNYRGEVLRRDSTFRQEDVDGLRRELAEATAARQREEQADPCLFSTKAPKQITPGTWALNGQYINNQGRVERWQAFYDVYGRQIGRTDYNAGNRSEGIPETHHHVYYYGPGNNGTEIISHAPGEYKP
jgi:hypothetical protein